MSFSVDGAVSAGAALQTATVQQEVQMTLLKKVLSSKASSMANLVDSAALPKPQGLVGGFVNTKA